MQEYWLSIKGYEGLYEISNLGRVRSFRRTGGKDARILSGGISKTGYRFVILCKWGLHKHFLIHRLAAIAFIDNPYNKPFINHIDFNRQNNNINNLEWVTSLENSVYSAQHGRMKTWGRLRGEQHGRHKLTIEQVIQIKSFIFEYKFPIRLIARQYNVSEAAIYLIKRGLNWTSV